MLGRQLIGTNVMTGFSWNQLCIHPTEYGGVSWERGFSDVHHCSTLGIRCLGVCH